MSFCVIRLTRSSKRKWRSRYIEFPRIHNFCWDSFKNQHIQMSETGFETAFYEHLTHSLNLNHMQQPKWTLYGYLLNVSLVLNTLAFHSTEASHSPASHEAKQPSEAVVRTNTPKPRPRSSTHHRKLRRRIFSWFRFMKLIRWKMLKWAVVSMKFA